MDYLLYTLRVEGIVQNFATGNINAAAKYICLRNPVPIKMAN